MSSFDQVLIGGYPDGGLMTDRKPMMLPNQAFSDLRNAYVFRDRTKKREGTVGMGQLKRILISQNIGVVPIGGMISINIASVLGLESTASIVPGSISMDIGIFNIIEYQPSPGVYTGQLQQNFGGMIVQGNINYATTVISYPANPALAGTTIFLSFSYYPGLPVMGILEQDIATLGIENTIFFDTVYAYQFTGGSFQELAPGTTWTGTNTDFFWSCNYQGATPDLKYFFTTNNNIDILGATYDPIRFYNNTTWTDLQPLVTATTTLWQGLIIVPYYGRLLVLNTWEGLTADTYTGAVNFSSRCRFSQIGDPTDQTNSWRSDIFGRGGFIDAPTNESIVSAAFYRNTLIVFFEYSTWQLRYVGEYGLPFIFERISSDFGAVSTFSPIIFDQGVMAVSDRGIIEAGAGGVKRLDDQIPETVFSFEIQNNAPNFVHGVRDFEKEVTYWNYFDTSNTNEFQSYPNTVLLFNYRNNTWAQFRDTITCFGTAQFQFSITWDSLTTSWESNASWDNVDDQNYVDYVTMGNQQGFISIYENPDAQTNVPAVTNYAPSLIITNINLAAVPIMTLTVNDHNLYNGEIIYITGAMWDGMDPGLNNKIYNVAVIDADTITLGAWNGNNYVAVSPGGSATYIGNGYITLFPKMNLVGKDFNPFQGNAKQYKLSYIDFLMDSNLAFPSIPAVTIQLFVNSYLGEQANLIFGLCNQEVSNSSQNSGFIQGATQANPCVITSVDHGLLSGTVIYIANVEGMTQLNSTLYTITVIDANTFSLNATDSTGFTAYTAGGIWNTSPIDGQNYIPGSEYAWYRFYSTQFGQFLRIGLTYDDILMNQLATHQAPMELHAMNCWFREGGRLIN